MPLPKSGSKQRIIENSQIFDFQLSEEDISSLDNLNEGKIIFEASDNTHDHDDRAGN